jgi:hypothetical protein
MEKFLKALGGSQRNNKEIHNLKENENKRTIDDNGVQCSLGRNLTVPFIATPRHRHEDCKKVTDIEKRSVVDVTIA